MSTSHTPPYRSLVIAGYVTIALLALGILADVVGTIAEAGRFGVLSDLDAGIDVGFDEVTHADNFAGISSLVQAGALLATFIGFLVWFARAANNVGRLGIRDPRYGTGWAVGGWFVPILSLWRPKQVANDVWRAGDPAAGADGEGWRERPVSQLLHWWWAAWIVTNVLGSIAAGDIFSSEPLTVSRQLGYSAMTIVANLASIVAAGLAIAFVYLASARQEERSWALDEGAAAEAAEDDAAPAGQPALQVA